MSPEQLMGDKVLDGRSDTYSLGCVLFEMLTGKPPFAGKEGFVRRFTEPPPHASSFRKNLPSSFDAIVCRALARAPGDRYQTAEEFVADLSHSGRAHSEESFSRTSGPGAAAISATEDTPDLRQHAGAYTPSRKSLSGEPPVAAHWAHPREWGRTIAHHPRIAAAIVLSVIAVSLALKENSVSRLSGALGIGSEVDSTRIALLPLAGTAPVRDRSRVTDGIYSALGEWRGLNIARDQDVKDEIQASGAPASTRSAAQLAKKLRAGRFIWGQVTAGDSLHGRIELYDLSTDTPLRSVVVGGVLSGPRLVQAARELLEVPGRPHSADGGDGRTTSYPAWTAYGKGHLALQNGDIATAQSAFRDAIASDPRFGPAHLWLAQSFAWESPAARQDWRDDVAQALRAESGLSPRDHLIATALSHMADRRYPEACTTYSQLTAADSLDFVGLYGLGQCHAFDSLVVRGASGGSGWQFRSRYSDAATAYMKALSVNPNAHAMLPLRPATGIAARIIHKNQTRQERGGRRARGISRACARHRRLRSISADSVCRAFPAVDDSRAGRGSHPQPRPTVGIRIGMDARISAELRGVPGTCRCSGITRRDKSKSVGEHVGDSSNREGTRACRELP